MIKASLAGAIAAWLNGLSAGTPATVIPAVVSLAGVFLGAWLGYVGGRRVARLQVRAHVEAENEKTLNHDRFSVYMKLLALCARYFWIATPGAEHDMSPGMLQTRAECFKLAWDIAEQIRRINVLPASEELLLDILFSESR